MKPRKSYQCETVIAQCSTCKSMYFLDIINGRLEKDSTMTQIENTNKYKHKCGTMIKFFKWNKNSG